MIRILIVALLLFSSTAHAFDLGFNMGFGAGGGGKWHDIISTLQISPTSKDFGSKDTGTNTDQVFTLSGTEAEEISLAVTGTGYSLLSTTCGSNPFNLLTGTCEATVRFTPASAGTLTGALTASWTNQSDVVAVLTGVGVSAGVTDNFATNTSTDYTGFYKSGGTTYFEYDAVNQRLNSTSEGFNTLVRHNTALTNDNHIIIATVSCVHASGSTGLIVRHDPVAGTGYMVRRLDGAVDRIRVDTITSNAPNAYLGAIYFSGGKTWAVGASYKMKVQINGARLSIWIDWNADGDFDDADEYIGYKDDSTYSTGKHVGFYFKPFGTVWADDLEAQ